MADAERENKYALHPGYVQSINDGESHFIDANQLSRLYNLRPNTWIVWDIRRPETRQGRNQGDYIHLYPRFDGDYRL